MRSHCDEIRQIAQENIDQTVNLALSDGDNCIAILLTVDDEGVSYNVEESGNLNPYWSRFEDVVSISPVS